MIPSHHKKYKFLETCIQFDHEKVSRNDLPMNSPLSTHVCAQDKLPQHYKLHTLIASCRDLLLTAPAKHV